METERQLLDAIRGGDRQAMQRLYTRFSGHAMAMAQRYVKDQEDVRDVVQDSFVRILTSIAHFDYRGEGSLKSWVARIVTNRAIDWVKEHEPLLLVGDVPDVEDPDRPPEVERVPPEVLNRMIGRLPVGCRVVLSLFVFEQLSHREIAHRLGIKENSSASQFFRAKHLLAEMIREYLESQRI